MTTQVFKAILAGILGGIALFMMPFIVFRIIIFFLIIGAIFRLLGRGRRGRFGICGNADYSERWRNMTHEERRAFREKMEKEFFNPSAQTPTADL